jgi:MFS family permease
VGRIGINSSGADGQALAGSASYLAAIIIPQKVSAMPRNLLIMISASLGFFFVTATTFTSLGYVLYTMVAELGWSQAAAGASFSLLGLACGLSSPLSPMLMKSVGTRLTMAAGGLVLAAGFALAAMVHQIGMFFVATSLMGIGFSLIAPSPAVFLIATWFPRTSARMIGFYFMAGALGGVAGPLIVNQVVGWSGSWRVHWMVMAIAALVLSVVFLLTIRDAVTVESIDQVKHAGASEPVAVPATSAWTVGAAMRTPTFMVIAFAMIVVQTVVTTMHSVLVTHVASFGHGGGAGALAMSLLAFTGTIAKGSTGALSERVSPKLLLVIGLGLQSVAMVLLALAPSPVAAGIAAMLFGVGWGFSWLTAHILLLRYFGAFLAAELVAMATMCTTFAVLGPLTAGWMADRTGSFTTFFAILAVLLAFTTVVTATLLRAPLPDRDAVPDHDCLPDGEPLPAE